MCGIAGILTPDRGTAEAAIKAMTDVLAHRGPDESGSTLHETRAGYLALGHRRLSILDLTLAGAQPMVHPQTGQELVFNGEIYNHQELRAELEGLGVLFTGHSDTEVLLHALSRWGAHALPKLAGMFAFAFFDPTSRTLLLARDPLGIKPLYVARVGPTLLFASEVRGVVASGQVSRNVNRAALATYLAFGAIQQPLSMFEDVTSFPAGHVQRIPLSPAQPAPPKPFWSFPEVQYDQPADLVAEIRSTLERAVAEHLVSDVPLGVFLSSGLDSTIIAGIAAEQRSGLRTFTVGLSEHPDMTEAPMAAATARRIGSNHSEVELSTDDARSQVDAWLAAQDQPSIDGLNTFIIAGAAKRAGVTVVLSGLGGDEVFGGYPSFSDVPRLMRLMRVAKLLPRSARAAAARLVSRGRPLSYRTKLDDMARSDGSLLSLYLHRRRASSNQQLTDLGIQLGDLGLSDQGLPAGALARVPTAAEDAAWAVSLLESRLYMGNMLLPDSDAMSMAHGLELRVPLLDRRLLDLVLPVPGATRLPGGRARKHLLRKAFGHLLSKSVAGQSKRGFQLPVNRWAAGALRPSCESALEALKDTGLLEPDGVDSLWRGFLADPESPLWSRAWSLVVLGSYLGRAAS